jgi:hypothetical protein
MAGLSRACVGGTLAIFVALSAVSHGQARPDARTMTCSQLQALLAREGAVTITTGQNTYDRFVSGSGACSGTSIARGASVATSDTGNCQVFTCGRRVRGSRR